MGLFVRLRLTLTPFGAVPGFSNLLIFNCHHTLAFNLKKKPHFK
jgi:hypothetical protein